MPGLFSLPKNLCLDESARVLAGETRGGSRPPRMGSNAPEGLLCKASGKRRADFCAEQRRKGNGIFPVYASARISPAIRSPSSAPRPKST